MQSALALALVLEGTFSIQTAAQNEEIHLERVPGMLSRRIKFRLHCILIKPRATNRTEPHFDPLDYVEHRGVSIVRGLGSGGGCWGPSVTRSSWQSHKG